MIGVGQQLGGYTILRRIGHGGLGDVFLAQHRRVARRAAVKVLFPELSQKPAVLAQFFKEVRNTSVIKHPGIVEILDCDLLDGQAFIVMEFLEGESLGGYLRRTGTLERDLAFRLGVVAAAAGAVGAAHVAGIMHRDLKPENIYLHLSAPIDPTVTVKVLDFGISKLSGEDGGSSQTGSGIWLGSPTYMSPEQCRGIGRPDARSDIYSLGCVLYEALCGRPPFVDHGMADLIAAHVSEAPEPPIKFVSGLVPQLNSFMLRMLAKNPEERPQTMTQVIGTLRDCAKAMGIDVDGQLQPLSPIERPTNLVGATPETAPVNPAGQKVRSPADQEYFATNPAERRPESRTMTAGERAAPLRAIPPRTHEGPPVPVTPLSPAAPQTRGGLPPNLTPPLPAPIARTLEFGDKSAQARSTEPGAEQPIAGLVGRTMILEPSADSKPLGVSGNPSPIRAVVGGTMIMDRSEEAEEQASERSHQEQFGPVEKEPWTGSISIAKPWFHRVVPALRQQGRLPAIMGVAVVLVAGVTAVILSAGPGVRVRPVPSAHPSRRGNSTAQDPIPTETAPPIATTRLPPVETPAAHPATVQIDIQGLAPRTIVTVDDQPATLPLRIPRGPEVHRIGLRSPTGRERTIEIDGTRDRAIELLVERQPTPQDPAALKQDSRDRASERDSGHKGSGASRANAGTAARKPALPKNELKAITDI